MLYYNGTWINLVPASTDLPPALPNPDVPVLPPTGTNPGTDSPTVPGFPPKLPGQGGYGIPNAGPGSSEPYGIPPALPPTLPKGAVVDECSITNLSACWDHIVSFLDAAGLNIAAIILMLIGVWILIGPNNREAITGTALKIAAA